MATHAEIVVRAEDDPHDLTKPRGKQDWQLEPHSIWYPRTTGIWQTVWLETVPATRIARVAFTPDLARWEIGVEVWVEGNQARRCAALRQVAERGDAAGRRHVSGRQRRGPSRRRAVGSGHRRLAQRAALEPARAQSDRRRDGTVGRARRTARSRSTRTRRCARWRPRAIASCSTGGPICCAWFSTRAIGLRAA